MDSKCRNLKEVGGKPVATIKRKPFEPNITNIKKLIRQEVKEMIKDGTIRFEVDTDLTFFDDTLEVKLDVYIDNHWVSETKDSVTLPK